MKGFFSLRIRPDFVLNTVLVLGPVMVLVVYAAKAGVA